MCAAGVAAHRPRGVPGTHCRRPGPADPTIGGAPGALFVPCFLALGPTFERKPTMLRNTERPGQLCHPGHRWRDRARQGLVLRRRRLGGSLLRGGHRLLAVEPQGADLAHVGAQPDWHGKSAAGVHHQGHRSATAPTSTPTSRCRARTRSSTWVITATPTTGAARACGARACTPMRGPGLRRQRAGLGGTPARA